MRARGLKLNADIVSLIEYGVAPRAGAWIETKQQYPPLLRYGVAPRAGAWIETSRLPNTLTRWSVAPRAGAWIETYEQVVIQLVHIVAPRAGAWIETLVIPVHIVALKQSRPVRARGLKHRLQPVDSPALGRAPCGRVD